MCYSCSEGKVFASCLSIASSKSPSVRTRVMKCIEALAVRSGKKLMKMSNFSELIPLLADYFEDAS